MPTPDPFEPLDQDILAGILNGHLRYAIAQQQMGKGYGPTRTGPFPVQTWEGRDLDGKCDGSDQI
jgi:hypothetical protein